MASRVWFVSAPIAAAPLALPTYVASRDAQAATPAAAEQESSSLDDQVELALTVYNSDLAPVRDVRSLQLPRGTFDLQFQDIAATVNPATVHFRSLSEPGCVSVLEQNYEYDPGSPTKDVVQVYYRFKNDEKVGPGLPMPGGVVRVYQADSTGALQFVGEDRIGHTPTDETANLKIGSALDVVAERKQTGFEKIGSDVYQVEYEVTLRNHKGARVTVEVNEPIGGTWRILQSSHPYVKTDAWAARFEPTVLAGGAVTVSYRVRVTY